MNGTSPTAYFTQRHALDAAQFPVDILDAAFAFGDLLMRAGGPGFLWKEQGAREALSGVAIGMIERCGGVHGQADRATRSAVRQAGKRGRAVLVEGDSRDAAMTSWRLIDVPRIKSGISSQVGGELPQGHDSLLIQGTKIGDIAFIEGLGVVGEHDGAIVSNRRDRHARTIAPEQFLLYFHRPIGLLLIGAALDAQAAIGIPGQPFGLAVALTALTPLAPLFHPALH